MITAHTIGLEVETQRGNMLGKIVDIEIDIESHAVVKYIVGPSSLVKQLVYSEEHLRIDPSEVISFTDKKMIVADLDAGETVDAGEELEAPGSITQKVRGLTSTDQKTVE